MVCDCVVSSYEAESSPIGWELFVMWQWRERETDVLNFGRGRTTDQKPQAGAPASSEGAGGGEREGGGAAIADCRKGCCSSGRGGSREPQVGGYLHLG